MWYLLFLINGSGHRTQSSACHLFTHQWFSEHPTSNIKRSKWSKSKIKFLACTMALPLPCTPTPAICSSQPRQRAPEKRISKWHRLILLAFSWTFWLQGDEPWTRFLKRCSAVCWGMDHSRIRKGKSCLTSAFTPSSSVDLHLHILTKTFKDQIYTYFAKAKSEHRLI